MVRRGAMLTVNNLAWLGVSRVQSSTCLMVTLVAVKDRRSVHQPFPQREENTTSSSSIELFYQDLYQLLSVRTW
jgi:hypothetical protein